MTTKIRPAKAVRAIERVRHALLRLQQRMVPLPVAMLELVMGAWVSQAIAVAADLGIADALAKGPLSLDELADEVGANPDALSRLMRPLIGRGVFRRQRDGRYGLTRWRSAGSDAGTQARWFRPSRDRGSQWG